MNDEQNRMLESLLLRADKPARYVGGEVNAPVVKENADLRFLMCFPDVYEVALSNLGIKILVELLNRRPDTACETCYAPWKVMGDLLSGSGLPLYSLETRTPIGEFGIVGFSLQYEMSYTNVLYMLDLGKIPLRAAERGEGDPVVVAGGPCVVNPMPMLPFFDLFSIGDGEEAIDALAAAYVENKRQGGTRADFLRAAAGIEGIFVPGVSALPVRRAMIKSLDAAVYPTKFVIPNVEAVHNRAVLEIFRGCTRGCRFCQAGFIYRPVRERKTDTLVRYAEELIVNNGFDELSLSSLSTCDYPDLKELLQKIKPLADKYHVSIALPSTRVDSFEAEFVGLSRKSSLTFAPEAGTQRLRDVINKNVTEEDVFTSMRYAFGNGYSSVKLYFMIGLPTETEEDLLGIVDLAARIKKLYRESATAKKPLTLSVSTSTFVPKPFTPFQWERQIDLDEIEAKQRFLKDRLKPLGIRYNWHDAKTSRLEATLARGDERMAEVVEAAYQSGCIFDGWSEFFDYDKWMAAFEACGVSPDAYTEAFDLAAPLAWECVDTGISRAYLTAEREKAYIGVTTDDCRKGCRGCGINRGYQSVFKAACAEKRR